MSGSIRQGIGLARNRLGNVVDKSRDLMKIPPTEETAADLMDQYGIAVDKLSAAVKTLSDLDAKWLDLIGKLDADLKDAEDKMYADVAITPGKGYLLYVQLGEDLQVELRHRITSHHPDSANQILQSRCRREVTQQQPSASSNPDPVKSDLARLPKFELPKFYGTFSEWNNFWAMFDHMVDSQNIPTVQKFSYLRSTLRSKAYDAISGLPLSDANYDIAIQTLKDRFGNPSVIRSSLCHQLKTIKCAADSSPSIRKKIDEVEQVLQQLKSAGVDVDQEMFVHIVIEKFPSDFIRRLRYTVLDPLMEAWDMSTLRGALKRHVKHHEWHQQYFHSDEGGQSSRESGKRQTDVRGHNLSDSLEPDKGLDYQNSSAFAFDSSSTKPENRQSHKKNPCMFCKSEEHYTNLCPKYPDVSTRQMQAINQGRCARCLKLEHLQKDCPTNLTIACVFCRKTGHHSALCPVSRPSNDSGGTAKSNSFTPMLKSHTAVKEPISSKKPEHSFLSVGEQTLFLTAYVPVVNPTTGMKMMARILLDSAGGRSYVTNHCCSKLKLPKMDCEEISVTVFAAKEPSKFISNRVEFDIVLKNGERSRITANTTASISASAIHRGSLPQEDLNQLRDVKHELADDINLIERGGYIDILIGIDYYWQFIGHNHKSLPSGLTLSGSAFGWLISGKYKSPSHQQPSSELSMFFQSTNQMPYDNPWKDPRHEEVHSEKTDHGQTISVYEADLKHLWDLESIGITDCPTENDDDRAMDLFRQSIELKNGRYWVSWPWKSDGLKPNDNYGLAKGRFRSLTKRLLKDEKLRNQYDELIKDQITRGFLELVDTSKSSSAVKHYIPHQPVMKLSSNTTKLRIVYDASAKSSKEALSLNDCLYRGPNLMQNLSGILLRFRLQQIAVVADIEKAYLQIQLHKEDRDVTRFFWFKDAFLPEPQLSEESNICVYRFQRVPFGVISSAFLLLAIILHHLQSKKEPIAEKMEKNTYADNVITGAENVDSAKSLYTYAKRTFSEASMNIREWCSNSAEFRAFLPEKDRADTENFTVLGLKWDVYSDNLCFPLSWTDEQLVAKCKRHVLRVVAKVFDPLGFWIPVTFYGKCFLQKLWSEKLGWDDDMGDKLQSEWSAIALIIKELNTVTIPRLLPVNNSQGNSLVVFCDASKKSYACCVYLRVQASGSASHKCNLVFAKMRLAPVKAKLTLPRLELMGLVIGVRAAKFVENNLHLPVDAVHIFTDSECCLFWVQTSKPLSVFVRNRVNEIRSGKGYFFHHVRTLDNPADLGTRGKTVPELGSSCLWWNGPGWLSEPLDSWPVAEVNWENVEFANDVDLEIRELNANFAAPEGQASIRMLEDRSFYPMLVNLEDYSDLRKLFRITAWRLKIFKIAVWRKLSHTSVTTLSNSVTVLPRVMEMISITTGLVAADILATKLLWDYAIQQYHFSDVFLDISNAKKNDLVQRLDIVLDENGILRSRGRLSNASLSEDAKNPKLLPSKSAYTNLVIADIHRRVMHSGTSHTLSQIRAEYWILKGRTAVGKVINSCLICRKLRGPPFTIPRMPDWPKSRVSESSPFSYTGLDYLGPVSVKLRDSSTAKVWVCLFTCLSTRAIHLEAAEDCSSKEFLNCLIRFVSRRGTPKQIISDNAPQFKIVQSATDRAWRNALFDPSVRYYSAERSISWTFITELAPWQGGFYERLVAVVKSCLKATIGRKLLTWREFDTLLAEAEAVVNSRPITFVYSDANSWYPLTPGDFMTASRCYSGLPDLDSTVLAKEFGDAGKKLIKYWKQRQVQLNSLWDIWNKEYLLGLRDKSRRNHRNPRSCVNRHPMIDEIVIVKDDSIPRGAWRLARVVQIIPSTDETIRSVQIQFPNGFTTRRSVGHLYPLELCSTQDISPIAASQLTEQDVATSSDFDPDSSTGLDVSQCPSPMNGNAGPDISLDPERDLTNFGTGTSGASTERVTPVVVPSHHRPSRAAADRARRLIHDNFNDESVTFFICSTSFKVPEER